MYARLLAAFALLAILVGPATGQRPGPQAVVQFAIAATSPQLSGELATGERLFVRIAYRSDRPVRFRLEAQAGGQTLITAESHSISPPYPAGEGEALVWIAFQRATAIDTIRIVAFDESWQPISAIGTQAPLAWKDGTTRHAIPAWAAKLDREQQAMGRQRSQADNKDGVSFGSRMLGLALIASLFGYPALQILVPILLRGRWRLAALLPLVAAVPLATHAVHALNAGSNLWPIWLIWLSPPAFLYLAVLAAAGWLARPSPRAQGR